METETFDRFRKTYWQAYRDLDGVRLRTWERSGVTLPQLRVLYQIRRAPGITTGDLARALGITVSTGSGLITKLVDRGLVERTTTPNDRRQLPLRLTEAGTALTGELSAPSQAYLRRVAEELGPDLAAVTAALARLTEATGRARATEDRSDGAASEPAATGERVACR